MKTNGTAYQVLGTTEDHDQCECCGRTNLKKTVAMTNEAGDIAYFGTTCAAYVLLGDRKSGSVKRVTTEAEALGTIRTALGKGIDANRIAKHVWNRYGLPTEARADGSIRIQLTDGIREVTA